MTEAYEEFLGEFPEYASTHALDALRVRDYRRLDAQHQVYLDYTGGGLYADSQVRAARGAAAQHVFGNPHSASLEFVGDDDAGRAGARSAVLDYFNARRPITRRSSR